MTPPAHTAPTTSTPQTTSKLHFSFCNINPCKQASWRKSLALQKGKRLDMVFGRLKDSNLGNGSSIIPVSPSSFCLQKWHTGLEKKKKKNQPSYDFYLQTVGRKQILKKVAFHTWIALFKNGKTKLSGNEKHPMHCDSPVPHIAITGNEEFCFNP